MANTNVTMTGFGSFDRVTPAPAVGVPASVQIGSDQYAAVILKTTTCTVTASFNRQTMTFRRDGAGSYRFRKHYLLRVGKSETRLDAGF